jgi:hypothetical protein
LFAHQSVGGNILSGVARIAGGRVTITLSRSAAAVPHGLRHYYVGVNGDPLGKIAEFASLFNQTQGPLVDVAMLKLCFLDFGPATDASAVAKSYITTLRALAAAHPQTRFVAITAPLTVVNTGSPRSLLRRLLGRAPSGVEANQRRLEFNEQLRRAFSGAELFDLARLESAGLGVPSTLDFNGESIETLDQRLSSDGGHLNELGQDLAAAHFLQFLAATPAVR